MERIIQKYRNEIVHSVEEYNVLLLSGYPDSYMYSFVPFYLYRAGFTDRAMPVTNPPKICTVFTNKTDAVYFADLCSALVSDDSKGGDAGQHPGVRADARPRADAQGRARGPRDAVRVHQGQDQGGLPARRPLHARQGERAALHLHLRRGDRLQLRSRPGDLPGRQLPDAEAELGLREHGHERDRDGVLARGDGDQGVADPGRPEGTLLPHAHAGGLQQHHSGRSHARNRDLRPDQGAPDAQGNRNTKTQRLRLHRQAAERVAAALTHAAIPAQGNRQQGRTHVPARQPDGRAQGHALHSQLPLQVGRGGLRGGGADHLRNAPGQGHALEEVGKVVPQGRVVRKGTTRERQARLRGARGRPHIVLQPLPARAVLQGGGRQVALSVGPAHAQAHGQRGRDRPRGQDQEQDGGHARQVPPDHGRPRARAGELRRQRRDADHDDILELLPERGVQGAPRPELPKLAAAARLPGRQQGDPGPEPQEGGAAALRARQVVSAAHPQLPQVRLQAAIHSPLVVHRQRAARLGGLQPVEPDRRQGLHARRHDHQARVGRADAQVPPGARALLLRRGGHSALPHELLIFARSQRVCV